MPQSPTLFFFFLFLPPLLSPPSMAETMHTTSDATYTFFLRCMKSHTNSSFSGDLVLSQSNSQFPSALSSTLRNLRFSSAAAPLLILTPRLPSHVSAAVLCARRRSLQIRIRSGGHDFEGLSYTSDRPNFILLDLSNFRRISVDLPTSTTRVGAGATIGELYFAIWSKSRELAFPAGLCPTVGVGGHLAGGGYGTLIRKHGLSIDHILDAEIVLSDGRILSRKTMGEDLFWAIRGGGGSSFGVILSYTVGLVAVPAAVTVFSVEKMVDEEVTELVYKWQVMMKEVDDNLFMRLLLQPAGKAAVKVTFLGLYLGPTSQLMETMKKEFPELGLQSKDCKEMSWAQSVLSWEYIPVEGIDRVRRTSLLTRMMRYRKWQDILLVGEGDFSFAACLAREFGCADNLTATSLDPRWTVISKYSNGLENLDILEDRYATVIHEVDAFTMNNHHRLVCMRFDRIIFKFPHAGPDGREDSISNALAHQELVAGFLKAAMSILVSDGEIHITHKPTKLFDGRKLVDLAKEAGLLLVDEYPFMIRDYPGYANKKAHGSNWDSSFPVG